STTPPSTTPPNTASPPSTTTRPTSTTAPPTSTIAPTTDPNTGSCQAYREYTQTINAFRVEMNKWDIRFREWQQSVRT
uniref:Uncharacterized protein n=1 Tax=Ciona savignyi TaxID=51511 RepID=H2Z999_CIOSA